MKKGYVFKVPEKKGTGKKGGRKKGDKKKGTGYFFLKKLPVPFFT